MLVGASATIVVVVVVYLVVLLAIGAWSRRESHDLAGYYVAGKKLPSWVIAFSANTTGESAWLLLGLTGMGYAIGLHALWIVLGEVVGVAIAWSRVALPFKAYTDRYESITVPDFLEARFPVAGAKGGGAGRETHVFRWLSLVIVLSMSTAYAAAQLTASGKAFDSFLGTGYVAGVLIGAVVIFYYTTVGGLKAVAYSDLLQGVLMFAGLLVLPIVGIVAAGGWSSMTSQLAGIDPSLLTPMGSLGLTVPGVISAAGFVFIGLAFLGAPQILTRFMAARSNRDIVEGGMLAVICMIVFDVGAVFAGLAGRTLFPGLADPETILPTMTSELMPAVFTGLFLVIVLAAIMSTIDSILILASATVVRDVIQTVFRPDLDEKRLAFYGKLTTVLIGSAGLLFALTEVRLIFWFVLFAWSGLACAFTPVVLCALF